MAGLDPPAGRPRPGRPDDPATHPQPSRQAEQVPDQQEGIFLEGHAEVKGFPRRR